MTGAELLTFPDLEQASLHAAQLTARAAREAVAARGRFALALSGGSTPGRYLELLAGQDMPWPAVHVFWADERLVPAEAPESNQRLARERLLDRAPLPGANVHPMPDPGLPLEDAQAQAQACEARLRAFFGTGGPPHFDAVHLGVGGDGHTASLFPGQPALSEATRWVAAVRYAGAKPPVARLTLTLPVLNAARLVFFLTSGADKLAIARAVLEGRGEGYPAGRVRPAGGRLYWLAG